MRLRIAKVDQQPITQILRNVAVKALDHLRTGGLIGLDYLPQVFWVELTGEDGRIHQIAEQDGELTALSVGRMGDVSSSGGWDIRHRWSLSRGVVRCRTLRCTGRRRRCWGTGPHQDTAVLIDGKPL